jgi:(+)-trans-carveol dehydrogenase
VGHLCRLDVVVANAGIGSTGVKLHQMAEPLWQATIDVNLSGVWKTVKAGVPHLLGGGRGASTILTSSVAGLKTYPQVGHYVAAKHGVVGLMRTFAVELGQHSIRPNLENPGPDDLAPICPTFHVLPIPWVTASDNSSAVLFLASDEARYITGVPLPVDAGSCLKLPAPQAFPQGRHHDHRQRRPHRIRGLLRPVRRRHRGAAVPRLRPTA